MPEDATEKPAAPPRRRVLTRVAVGVLVGLLVAVGVSWGLMETRALRPPYPPLGQAYARLIGCEDAAFNVGEVTPGRLYRSGQPDAALIRHLHAAHGIQRLITLNGTSEKNSPVHGAARELGIEVFTFNWSSRAEPPPDELERVLRLMAEGGPTLVHCSAGSDRTGLACALYRVRFDGWDPARAIEEMGSYWHDAKKKPAMQSALRRAIATGAPAATGPDE